jgi:zinc protease
MELRRTASIASMALLVAAATAQAQSTASQTQAFEVDGIHVILAPADNQIVSVIVGLEGGVASGETTNPAIGPFASDLITDSGSKKYPQDQFRKFLSQTSTTIIGGGDLRGINYVMNATRTNFDRAWDVLASLVTEPAYDQTAFGNIKQRRLAQVKNRWTNPESQAFLLADSLVKLGNPVLSNWTHLPDVESITVPMIQQFVSRLTERSRLLVVVVGKVTADEIKQKLAAFKSLPAGKFSPAKIPTLEPEKGPRIEVVDRPVVTTYIYGAFPGPRANDGDYWPLYVGLSHLGSVVFEEVRTKRNLSYAPSARLSSSLGQGVGMIGVSTTFPDSSIAIMYRELEKMKTGDFTKEDLDASKQVFLTGYFMNQMTNGDRANSLYNAERNAGDWQRAYSYDAINSVSKGDVEKAFRKYARNLQVGIVGKKAGLTESKFEFKE